MQTWLNFYIQDSNTPNMNQLIFFHDYTMLMLIMITTLISYMFIFLMINKITNRFMINEHFIETIWTITPMITLFFIAVPSLKILYMTEEFFSPTLTVKAIGHQWYWHYEFSDYLNISFESYMLPMKKNNFSQFRLLDVDNRLILPFNTPIRILTTSTDVIHSWAVPALGIKIDATPGRMNQTFIYMIRPGIFFGQCSEICGMNHSFMPIMIESTSMNFFMNWIKNFNS
uniref:Cytochrome c oxidase subunit 2 n=2 Tax=Vespula germanica TaxID=30212 RepID=A0A0U2GS92_VESGE|nr:cytochrome c oxidase subunit II [Vespula germanica]UZG65633.1 cytochrome c oxidase subunit 2 [Vespula germanica]UZG65654.1 cytochrome c oxidase subunit 2 [Vespula germanica]UZG65667.1 cytochrome c oxidase subunit 2 [Vespula germanica]UZG65680.1 cytochrome c oxidase subunit 2 [Vespula germanica]